MTTYQVTVTRDGKFWLIHVPAIERWTQARRVSEIRETAQDLIEIMTGEPAETIDLDVTISLPPEVQERTPTGQRESEGSLKRGIDHYATTSTLHGNDGARDSRASAVNSGMSKRAANAT